MQPPRLSGRATALQTSLRPCLTLRPGRARSIRSDSRPASLAVRRSVVAARKRADASETRLSSGGARSGAGPGGAGTTTGGGITGGGITGGTSGGATTGALGALNADSEPAKFDVVTSAIRRWPRSAPTTAYCGSVAPATGVQLAAPLAAVTLVGQRSHWYANELTSPSQRPDVVASCAPSWAVPASRGGEVLDAALWTVKLVAGVKPGCPAPSTATS